MEDPKFVVAPGKSIIAPYPGQKLDSRTSKRRKITEGRVVPHQDLSERELRSLFEGGYILAVESYAAAEAIAPKPVELARKKGKAQQLTKQLSEHEKQDRINTRGKWSVNPDRLVGKTHDELLVMILDKDQTADVDGMSHAEAIAYLTRDYQEADDQDVFDEIMGGSELTEDQVSEADPSFGQSDDPDGDDL